MQTNCKQCGCEFTTECSGICLCSKFCRSCIDWMGYVRQFKNEDLVDKTHQPACEISDAECKGDTHQPVGHDLWFCEAHGA